MLIVTRRIGEVLRIGIDIRIEVLSQPGRQVKLAHPRAENHRSTPPRNVLSDPTRRRLAPPHRVDRPVALRPVRSSAIPQTVAMHTLLRSGQRGIRGTVTGCGCPTRSPARALTSAGNPRNPHHPRPPSEPQEHRAERGSSTAGSIPNSCRDACPLDPSELWPIPDPDPLEPLETPKPNMGHRPPATRPPIPLRSQPTAYEAGALLLFVSSARPPS